tara:strand:+ start:1212 stop:1415 length:204 start_codon:yes stop_codon:yes gene_type:complete
MREYSQLPHLSLVLIEEHFLGHPPDEETLLQFQRRLLSIQLALLKRHFLLIMPLQFEHWKNDCEKEQ